MKVKHDLKILEEYFTPVVAGSKTFEIRKNDRDYQVGDVIVLCEWIIEGHFFSGKKVFGEITYVTNYAQQDGYVVFSFKLLPVVDMYA